MQTFTRPTLVLACLLATGFSSAGETAVYKDGSLLLDELISIDDVRGDRYLKQVHLKNDRWGRFIIAGSQTRPLAMLDTVELEVLYGATVEVELQVIGNKRNPCVELEPVASRRVGDTFHVLIAETPQYLLMMCAQVLEPFELTVSLDATGLKPGDYRVKVNNEVLHFSIDETANQGIDVGEPYPSDETTSPVRQSVQENRGISTTLRQ
jgi:hypothetical protein